MLINSFILCFIIEKQVLACIFVPVSGNRVKTLILIYWNINHKTK